MKKRRFGLIDKLPSGKYRARYTGPDGVRHKAATTFFDEADAIAWLRSEQKLIEFDEWTPPAERNRTREDQARTVGDWLNTWLNLNDHELAPSTMQDYRRTLNARILKATGRPGRLRDVPLIRLRRREIIEWWDACQTAYGHQTYNHNAYRRLHTALNAAVDRELIPANPASGIAAIRKKSPERKELPELPVMEAILDEMPDATKLVTILTLFHGMRIGEALALKRQHIIDDGETITVRIRGNLWRKVGEGMVYKDTPKTDAGYRDVPIFKRFHPDVRRHLKEHTGGSAGAWLFTTATGKTMMDTSFRSIQSRAKKRAGYDDIRLTPHYGRNWLITTLAEAHMTPVAIGEILGQRDLRTITEVYMRATAQTTRAILDDVDKAISNPKKDSG